MSRFLIFIADTWCLLLGVFVGIKIWHARFKCVSFRFGINKDEIENKFKELIKKNDILTKIFVFLQKELSMKKKESNPISNWSLDDRPREKLLLKGTPALSDAELIAILIGSGSREESAVALAKRILKSTQNNINTLAKVSLLDLQKFKGIGEAKAVSVVAALELGRRRRLETALETPKISTSKDAFELLQPILGDLHHEEFWVIYLNNANKVVLKKQLGKGGFTGTLVDIRMVCKNALENNATSMILCHNHPSGKMKPSQSDLNLTKKIIAAGKTLDINVLDHIIVADEMYFSFADEGVI